MVHIYGGITHSGQDLVLVAGGPGTPADVARAAKQLEPLTPHFGKSDPPGGLITSLDWATVVQLSNTYRGAFIPTADLAQWIAEESRRRTAPLADRLAYTCPAGVEPRAYQIEGALEIARTGRALIFDEPRTGKTWTTILGLLERSYLGHAWVGRPARICGCGWAPNGIAHPSLTEAWRRHVTQAWRLRGPVLVVCPASVIDPWVETWNLLAPHLRAVAWRGSKRYELAGTADVYVTSYDTARIDTPHVARKGALLDLEPAALVLDECHYVKNQQAERTKSVIRLGRDVEAFVALSGTPITHHPADLWPVLRILAPGANPARGRWVQRYCSIDPYAEYGEGIIGLDPLTEPEFRVTILGQHRRVARADVMSQLPPKVYSTRTVELPSTWRKAYDDFEGQMLAELPTEDGGWQELSVMDRLSVFTHLSALASSAADVRVEFGPDVDEQTGEPKRHVHLDLKPTSSRSYGWKVDALLEILEERCRQDAGEPVEKVVVFAPSAQLIKLAGEAAAKAGFRVGYVIGGQAAGVRTETIRSFQHDPEGVQVILATTSAGGEGITLSAAGTVIFLQRPWSLVKSIQAEDRAEGDLTATRGTEVIDIVARNTIDTRIREALKEHAGQLSELLQDPRIVTELLGGSRHTQPERKSA